MLLLGDPPEGKTHSRVACEEIEDEEDAYGEADDEQALYVHIAVEEIYGPVDQDGEGILGAYEAEIAEQLEDTRETANVAITSDMTSPLILVRINR